jgi:hypothetical protein
MPRSSIATPACVDDPQPDDACRPEDEDEPPTRERIDALQTGNSVKVPNAARH